ncbi:g6698 [Coccomyxa viridis]|uniref:G6698 protein n=1 Tax=Coccomyxa viridis TaxID=1274662 RepID=A0ABP1FW07_9CHLO
MTQPCGHPFGPPSAKDSSTAWAHRARVLFLKGHRAGSMTYEASILETCTALRDSDVILSTGSLFRRARKMHFQLQVTIGSYGYEPVELYLVHGVLAFLALVVVHCILTEVKTVMVWLWVLLRSPSTTL